MVSDEELWHGNRDSVFRNTGANFSCVYSNPSNPMPELLALVPMELMPAEPLLDETRVTVVIGIPLPLKAFVNYERMAFSLRTP
jgi:hypothetical protein